MATVRPLATVLATLLILVATPLRAAAPPVTVRAEVETGDVAVGEPFLLSIAVEGAQNVPVPIVEVDDFRSNYMGPSTQVSFVNGRMATSVTHRYRMIAEREGQFTLGPFAVAYDGQRLETNTVAVRVRPAGTRPDAQAVAPGGAGALRLVVQPSRGEVFVGERVGLTVTLFVGDVRVDDAQFPQIVADGVTVEKFAQPEQGSQVVDGRRFTTLTLRTTLTPLKAGLVDLRTTMKLSIVVVRRGMDPILGQLLPGASRQVELAADPSLLTVLALPDEGRPADFTGAVGNFSFDMRAGPTTVDAGDPITVRMEIAGSGNLAAASPPPFPTSDRFRQYDAQPVKGEDGAERRVFEQVLIPRVAGPGEIPALRFSFFDPDARTYRTITRGPIAIDVHAAAPGQAAVLDAEPVATPSPAPAALGRDIVYIKDAPGALRPRGARWYGGVGWLALLLALPVAVFAATTALVRRRDRLAAEPRLVRFRAAGRDARRAIAAAAALPGDASGFFDGLAGAVTAYLAAKLDLPPGGVDRGRVLSRLADAGVEPPLHEQVARFFDLAEQTRYAAGRGASRDEALALATAIVDGLERMRGLGRRLAVLALLLAAASMNVADAAEPPQAAFFAGNQAYAAGRYDDAVQSYEAARAAGVESGALLFNLGNAYVKRGDLGRAIASYERSVRLLPRDPDVAANLAFAREEARLEAEPAPFWQRLVAPFAYHATAAELAAVFAVAWAACWLLLAARAVAPGLAVGLGRGALVAALVAAVVGASLVVRITDVDTPVAVVVAAGSTPVRFEPSATGTEHFVAVPGTRLVVAESRDGWLQVRRGDGRRGWIESAAVETIP